MSERWIYIILVLLIVDNIKCHVESRAYQRQPFCDNKQFDGNPIVEGTAEFIVPNDNVNQLKGFSGTISIVGGSYEHSNDAYFAAITALKVS